MMYVSSKTATNTLAGAIAGVIQNGYDADLSCIGDAAIGKAIKGVATASNMTHIDMVIRPKFEVKDVGGKELTSMLLKVSKGSDDNDEEKAGC